MRIASSTLLAALFAGCLATAQSLQSQVLQTTSGTGFRGAPYSARETTVDMKTTADGTRYTNTYVNLLWRDAEGRTRQEHLEKSRSGADIHSVVITDPVAGVYLKWSFGDESMQKVMTIWPLPARQRVTAPPPDQSNAAAHSPDALSKSEPRPCGAGCTIQTERLAAQEINGIYAEGRRTTRSFKAGTAENGQDLVVTVVNEIWISPELGIIVRHITDDSRTGRNATEVTEIVRGDPDPALFTAPDGYRWRDMRSGSATSESLP